MPGTHRLLDKKQTDQKIKRIAYEIYEQNFAEDELILAGVCDNGYQFAQMLAEQLQAIAAFRVTLVRVDLNKAEPLSHPITVSPENTGLEDKCIVVVDDVLNTGRTLAYSLRPFLRTNVRRLQVAVLVDRGYKLFPVAADYIGYALSTTLQEHIEVSFEGDNTGVFLQ